MAADEIAAAEGEANRIVWEDRPVAIRYASGEEAAALKLRKEPVRRGTLRLVEVEGFDLSACGGTHVARTGAIGVIAVGAWERFKGGQRVEFLCGGRALERFRRMRDAVAAGVRLLSVAPEDLAASIERLLVDGREQKRALDGLKRELAEHRAAALAESARAETHNGREVNVILRESYPYFFVATESQGPGGAMNHRLAAAGHDQEERALSKLGRSPDLSQRGACRVDLSIRWPRRRAARVRPGWRPGRTACGDPRRGCRTPRVLEASNLSNAEIAETAETAETLAVLPREERTASDPQGRLTDLYFD